MSVFDEDPACYEAFVLYRAYSALVEYLRPDADPRTASPGDLVGLLAGLGDYRAACLIVVLCPYLADSIGEATPIVDEVRAMCEQGRRPRYLMEMVP